jgi:hypothetical protein
MEVKPTNTYKHLRVSSIANIVNPLHVHVQVTIGSGIFCDTSFVTRQPEGCHKYGRNLYMGEAYYVYNIRCFLNVYMHWLISSPCRILNRNVTVGSEILIVVNIYIVFVWMTPCVLVGS